MEEKEKQLLKKSIIDKIIIHDVTRNDPISKPQTSAAIPIPSNNTTNTNSNIDNYTLNSNSLASNDGSLSIASPLSKRGTEDFDLGNSNAFGKPKPLSKVLSSNLIT